MRRPRTVSYTHLDVYKRQAVTRAKSKVYLIGRAEAVARMVTNNLTKKRYSGFQRFLEEKDDEDCKMV